MASTMYIVYAYMQLILSLFLFESLHNYIGSNMPYAVPCVSKLVRRLRRGRGHTVRTGWMSLLWLCTHLIKCLIKYYSCTDADCFQACLWQFRDEFDLFTHTHTTFQEFTMACSATHWSQAWLCLSTLVKNTLLSRDSPTSSHTVCLCTPASFFA